MLLVHLDDPSPRARYIVGHMAGRMTGWEVAFAASEEEFRGSAFPKLRYGRDPGAGDPAVVVPASGWLERPGTWGEGPPVGEEQGLPVLFPSAAGHDPFAGAFYLLARLEETGGHARDTHGRLPWAEHFVVRHGIERLPVVDHWALRLAERLRARFPGLPAPARAYRQVVTVDVDNGLKYLGRPYWKQFGAMARDLVTGRAAEAVERLRVLLGMEPDPFDRYGRLAELARSGPVSRVLVFALMRGEGRFDHAASHRHPVLRDRLARLAAVCEMGTHPSYHSSEDPALTRAERERLEAITGAPVHLSRQHFLRWRCPETLRALDASGFREEHSLGFSDRWGFRAGTCTPFPWYDAERERETALMLWPFTAMDSALRDGMGMGPGEALRAMAAAEAAVRAVGGAFVSVWHDRFLSGHGPWAGWPEAFDGLVEHARP